jgi:signal transduction histidine kinase
MTFEPNPLALLPLTCCAVGVRLATLTIRRAPGLAAAGIGAATWNGCVALAACLEPSPLVLWLARLSLAATFVIAAGLLVYLVDAARLPARRAWSAAGIAVAAAGALLALGDPLVLAGVRRVGWGGGYGVAGAHVGAALALLALLLLLPFVRAALALRGAPRSRRRRQLAHAVAAVAIGLLGGIDVLGVLGHDVPPIGWATSTVALVLLTASLVRLQLVSARTAFVETRFWALFVAGTFLPLFGITLLAAGWGGWRNVLGRGLALVALGLVGARLGPGLRRLVGRRRDEHAARLRAFAAATRSPAAPAEVLPPLCAATGSLSPAAVAIGVEGELAAAAHLELLPVAAASATLPAPPPPLPETLVTRDDAAGEPADDPSRRWLDALGGDVLVPLRWRRETVGVLALRAPPAGADLDGEDREFLERLGRLAAVALTNAALHDRLSRRAAHLAREVDERTRSLAQAIGEQRAAQARLVAAEKQSSLALAVAGVSHEVNNALNFIYANAPVLAEYAAVYDELFVRAGSGEGPRAAAARLRRGADAVGEAAQRARGLVEDLRRFARADESELKRVDLRDALRAAERIVATQLPAGVDLARRIAEAPPGAYVVEAYPASLHHAILALLVNAVQAVGARGTVTVELEPKPGRRVRLAVCDDGPGVDDGDRERIFEPFYTTRPGAAGLGLSSSRLAAQRLGGTLELEPPPGGKGACFALELPGAAA